MTSPSSRAPATANAASAAGAILSVGNTIGRYFSLTSMVPSALFVLWIYVLLASGAGSGPPDLNRLAPAFTISAEKVSGLVLATLFVGLFLHPLQFGMTRLLEGYWGVSSVALSLSAARINHHRAKARDLNDRAWMHKKSLLEPTALQAKLTRKDEGDSKPSQASLLAEAKQLLGSCLGDALIRDALGHQEALRKRSEEYPSDDRILPTRLGNALRNFEDSAGAQYHLNAITAAPHLFLVGNSVHVQYVEDQAQTMDTSIRLCAISTLASVGAVAILITDGPWLFVALLPYILAYVAYRGAVSAARNYGIAIAALIDMNRFALYDAMHMRRPRDLAAEREQNELLMKLLKSEDVHMTYRPDTDNPSRLSSLRTKGSGRR